MYVKPGNTIIQFKGLLLQVPISAVQYPRDTDVVGESGEKGAWSEEDLFGGEDE
jgi:hypothetical protein